MNQFADQYDQYYTNSEVAKFCVDSLSATFSLDTFDVILEPSSGDGAFFNLLPEKSRYGIDIDPKHPEVEKADFLSFVYDLRKSYLVVGNPPFGQNASMALKFFNTSARFADIIAFILPRTFRKKSIVNRLNDKFHLIKEHILPDDSFVYNSKPYNVPCVFQIWQRKKEVRPPLLEIRCHSDFKFTTKSDASFAIQRVGHRAGLIRLQPDLQSYSEESHYFISTLLPDVLDIMRRIDFTKVKLNTAGNPSVSRSELVELYDIMKKATQKIA